LGRTGTGNGPGQPVHRSFGKSRWGTRYPCQTHGRRDCRNAVFKRRIDEIGPMIVVFQEIKAGTNVKGVAAEEIRS
jgi:hypothetical protein